MSLDILRVIVDFGLVVLIWLVQLVIYPSFSYYTREGLKQWHAKYTGRVSIVVFPLMNAQIGLGIYQLAQGPSWYTIASVILMVLLWLSTFIVFVPMHNRIDKQAYDIRMLTSLVNKNWWRTAMWSAIFVIDLVYLFLH